MGHTRNEITINAPYSLVFDISNTIERWTELFCEPRSYFRRCTFARYQNWHEILPFTQTEHLKQDH